MPFCPPLILSFSYFTKYRRIPTFWSLLVSKSKPNFLPNLSWRRQSSKLFLLTPTYEAASSRLYLFSFSSWVFPLYNFLHLITFSMISLIVRSLVRLALVTSLFFESSLHFLGFLCFFGLDSLFYFAAIYFVSYFNYLLLIVGF